MTLPNPRRHRIERLSQFAHPSRYSLNLYICSYCGETQWGKDNDPPHEDWREGHRAGILCFNEKSILEAVPEYAVALTETEFHKICRRGGVHGVTVDMSKQRNRSVRYRKA